MKMWIESIAFTPYNENGARVSLSELIGPPYDTTKPMLVHSLSFFTFREDVSDMKPGDKVDVNISIKKTEG